MITKKICLLSLLSLLLVNCATVKFYNDAGLKQETGIKIYYPKPYLLVEKEPAKDVALKATIIYLPDKANPQYAKIKSGFGSSDLKIAFQNGMITSYGVTNDSKLPETITALTGILSASGTAYKSLAEAKDLLKNKDDETPVAQKADVTDMDKVKKQIENIIKDLETRMDTSVTSSNQKKKIKDIIELLKKQVGQLNLRRLKDISDIAKALDKVIPQFDELLSTSDTPKAKDHNAIVKQAKKELQKSKDILVPKKSNTSFELYEIIVSKEGTKFKKVIFNE